LTTPLIAIPLSTEMPLPSHAAEDDGCRFDEGEMFAAIQYVLTKRHFYEAMRPLIYSRSMTVFRRCLAVLNVILVGMLIIASVLILSGATNFDGNPAIVTIFLILAAALVFLVCNMHHDNCRITLQQNIWYLMIYFGYPDYQKQSVCRVRCSKDYIEFGRGCQVGQERFNWMETYRWTDVLDVLETKNFYVLKLDRAADTKVELPRIFPRFKVRIYDGVLIRKDAFIKGDWTAVSERLAQRNCWTKPDYAILD
jgi:predicted Fe-S protein YdhL (DUF1289 family)